MIKKYLDLLIPLFPLGIVFLGYALNIVAVVDNRIGPSFESAFGTEYGFAFGLLLVLFSPFLAMLTYNIRSKFRRHAIISVAASLACLLLGLNPPVTF